MSSLFQVNAREHGALLLMGALARQKDGEFLRLQTVAEDLGLSAAYLEEIAAALKFGNLIRGRQGPGGGYQLTKVPADISIEDILIAVDGPVALVDCQLEGKVCPVASKCSSQHVWNKVRTELVKTLRSTTLAQTLDA